MSVCVCVCKRLDWMCVTWGLHNSCQVPFCFLLCFVFSCRDDSCCACKTCVLALMCEVWGNKFFCNVKKHVSNYIFMWPSNLKIICRSPFSCPAIASVVLILIRLIFLEGLWKSVGCGRANCWVTCHMDIKAINQKAPLWFPAGMCAFILLRIGRHFPTAWTNIYRNGPLIGPCWALHWHCSVKSAGLTNIKIPAPLWNKTPLRKFLCMKFLIFIIKSLSVQW